ncbi:dihydroorotate dehydrogenase [Serratia marcescens]
MAAKRENDCVKTAFFAFNQFQLGGGYRIIRPRFATGKSGESMYYPLIRKALFQLDPERAHEVTFRQLSRITGTPLAFLVRQSVPTKPVNCMGLSFKNPLGLAAGLDKNGECIDAFGAMGFGHVEVGTVTPRPQPGNDKPRLFRVVEAEGLINRMGFNNHGVDNLVENVKKSHFGGILGINIGKNKDTPVEQGKDDYLICMDKVYPYAGYIAINISSPNTPGLRSLQYGEALDDLLAAIKNKQQELHARHHKYVPVAVKIAPDLSEEELIQIADSLVRHNIDGVIATNTTLDRKLIQGLNYCEQAGGLSGRPLQSRSTEVIRRLSTELQGRLPIIGVGGIDSLTAAREKMEAGASLLQIYSGFIYHGPRLIKDIVTHI